MACSKCPRRRARARFARRTTRWRARCIRTRTEVRTRPEAFHALKRAYDVLMDPNRRARYDRAGSVSDELEESAFEEAYERYKSVEITEEDIEEFLGGYRESEAELRDLVAYVRSTKGDMTRILESMMGSEDVDAERYAELVDKAFKEDKIPRKYRKTFEKTKNSVLSIADLEGEDLDDDDDDDDDEDDGKVDLVDEVSSAPPSTDLLAMFAARREQRESRFDQFAKKWQAVAEDEARRESSSTKKKKKRKRPENKAA